MATRSRADAFDLESTLPYLLNRAGVRIGQAFSAEIAVHALTLPEWRLLASLLARETQSLSELALHTSIELSRASRLIAGLAKRRLVKRVASDADGRAWEISLTDAGATLARTVVPIAQRYERIGLAGMAPEEVRTLKRLLGKVYENLDVAGG